MYPKFGLKNVHTLDDFKKLIFPYPHLISNHVAASYATVLLSRSLILPEDIGLNIQQTKPSIQKNFNRLNNEMYALCGPLSKSASFHMPNLVNPEFVHDLIDFFDSSTKSTISENNSTYQIIDGKIYNIPTQKHINTVCDNIPIKEPISKIDIAHAIHACLPTDISIAYLHPVFKETLNTNDIRKIKEYHENQDLLRDFFKDLIKISK